MPKNRLASVQRGVALADAIGTVPKPRRAAARKRKARARRRLPGPFLSPGSLGLKERLRLIDGIHRVIEGVYTHLPLKRARYGFDPVQRLCILRTQIEQFADDAFHFELADIMVRLRDAHTQYSGPAVLEGKVAVLPFLVEMIGSADAATYVVTKVGKGLDPAFKPGVVLEFWNGVPIDRAVMRHGERDFGGRPDSQRACAVAKLTLRALRYGPPPDELWVVVGYRTVPASGGPGQSKEIRIPWRIVDPNQVARMLPDGSTATMAKALRRTRAVDPAAEAIRRAKMLLFAPHVLTGRRARARRTRATVEKAARCTAVAIKSTLPETLKAASIESAGGPFGYLRVWAFDADPGPFITELLRLIPLLPDRGLIIDVRGNPGGYIWAAELALQLFTPNRIEPTRFSALATAFVRQIATIKDVAEDLAPWKPSLDAAVRNGELYAQPIPITDPEECNALGQHYGGPVVLVADSTTYSSGDLFSAGFVDNRIGPFICVGSATGAGGANVWEYGELRKALAGSRAALPALPDGIDLSFSFRRATRARDSEGLPIEDVGVAGIPYAMTRNDLLNDNEDLIATCVEVLRQLSYSRLSPVVDRKTRSIEIATTGLDRLDTSFDGRPHTSESIGKSTMLAIRYPAGTRSVELAGFAGGEVRQRRRISIRP